jgi:membrane protein DedA with SNARE-associated domain
MPSWAATEVHLEDVRRAEAWFDRHGRWAVFLGRMSPALGSLIWNTVFVYGGYALGTRWYLVERYSGVFQVVVLVLLVALVVFMLVKRYRRHRERVRVMNAPTEVIERPGR